MTMLEFLVVFGHKPCPLEQITGRVEICPPDYRYPEDAYNCEQCVMKYRREKRNES